MKNSIYVIYNYQSKKLKQNNIIRDNENKRCIKYTMKADERLNIY